MSSDSSNSSNDDTVESNIASLTNSMFLISQVDKLDPFETVVTMRRQRNKMVQKPMQYNYMFRCLADYVAVEKKEGNLGGDSESLTEVQKKLAEVTRLKDEAEERNRILIMQMEYARERIRILSKEKEDAIKALEMIVNS